MLRFRAVLSQILDFFMFYTLWLLRQPKIPEGKVSEHKETRSASSPSRLTHGQRTQSYSTIARIRNISY